MFWENHDPTQGMRQGNDVGTQYRSGIYYFDEAQKRAAEALARRCTRSSSTAAGYGAITTEILPAPEFYYAEDYHQQYLAKNPDGYCGLGGTGVSCPVGSSRATRDARDAVPHPLRLRSRRCVLDRRGDFHRPLPSIRSSSRSSTRSASRAVVTAAPGAGKTTRVPPALVADGPVILLQPRRVAARAIAARIADERGWTIGREVGWQVRFERRFSADDPAARRHRRHPDRAAAEDPLLSDFRTIVLDEFHERSIHADLGLALARQAWRARDDLRLVVMSATLDARAVAAFLDDCPVVDVPGRLHPLEIVLCAGADRSPTRRPTRSTQTAGDVLCFLPGAPEIRRAIDRPSGAVRRRRRRRPAARLASTPTSRTSRCGRRRRAGASSSPPTSPRRR